METWNNLISRNHITGTNGPGIQVVGSFNTIDENSTLSNTGIGITVGGSKNTVIRNNSLGNVNQNSSTNYSITAANNFGGTRRRRVGIEPLVECPVMESRGWRRHVGSSSRSCCDRCRMAAVVAAR